MQGMVAGKRIKQRKAKTNMGEIHHRYGWYDQGRRSGYESGGGDAAYMSTQREVVDGKTGSHRAKRANFGRGVRGCPPGKCQKPTWQMVQSTLFLSYICEYY